MKTVLARFKTYGKQPKDLAKGDAPAVFAPVRRDVPEGKKDKGKKKDRQGESRRSVAELGAARPKARERPVTIGLAGAGQMGTDLVVQLALHAGLAHRRRLRDRAPIGASPRRCWRAMPPTASSRPQMPPPSTAAIEIGKLAITDDLEALAAAGRIDVVIDATGNPNVGTTLALDAIANGKHIVMLNVEADITIGRYPQ